MSRRQSRAKLASVLMCKEHAQAWREAILFHAGLSDDPHSSGAGTQEAAKHDLMKVVAMLHGQQVQQTIQ